MSTFSHRAAAVLALLAATLAPAARADDAATTSATTSAESITIGLHLATHHLAVPHGTHLQGHNPGLYARLPSGLTLGAYHNSEGRGSAYAGYTWSSSGGTWGLTAGVVTGYVRHPVAPLLVPSLRLPLGAWAGAGTALRLSFLPKPHPRGAAGLHLSVETTL